MTFKFKTATAQQHPACKPVCEEWLDYHSSCVKCQQDLENTLSFCVGHSTTDMLVLQKVATSGARIRTSCVFVCYGNMILVMIERKC